MTEKETVFEVASDLKTIKDMLTRAKIDFEIVGDKTDLLLTVEGGYSGFFTEFTFDTEDRLVSVKAYE